MDWSRGVAPKDVEVGEAKLNPLDVGADVTLPLGVFACGLRLGSIEVMCNPEGILFVEPPDLRFLAPGCPTGFVGLAGRERFRGVAAAVLGCVAML